MRLLFVMCVFVTTHDLFTNVAHSVQVSLRGSHMTGGMAAMQPAVSFGRGVDWCGTHQVGEYEEHGTRSLVHPHARLRVASSEVAGKEMVVHDCSYAEIVQTIAVVGSDRPRE